MPVNTYDMHSLAINQSFVGEASYHDCRYRQQDPPAGTFVSIVPSLEQPVFIQKGRIPSNRLIQGLCHSCKRPSKFPNKVRIQKLRNVSSRKQVNLLLQTENLRFSLTSNKAVLKCDNRTPAEHPAIIQSDLVMSFA